MLDRASDHLMSLLVTDVCEQETFKNFSIVHMTH